MCHRRSESFMSLYACHKWLKEQRANGVWAGKTSGRQRRQQASSSPLTALNFMSALHGLLSWTIVRQRFERVPAAANLPNFSKQSKTSTGFMSASAAQTIIIIATILSKKREELHIIPCEPSAADWVFSDSSVKLWNQWISATGPLKLQDN